MPEPEDLKGGNLWRVQRKRPLDPNTIRDLTHRECLAQSASGPTNHNSFKRLGSVSFFALFGDTFLNTYTDSDGISRTEWRDILPKLILLKFPKRGMVHDILRFAVIV